VLLDELVEVRREAPGPDEVAPAPGEAAPVAPGLGEQRAIGTLEAPALGGDAVVDLDDALHPPRLHAALQVRLDRALGRRGAPREGLAEPRVVDEVLLDQPLDGRAAAIAFGRAGHRAPG
jgi:hypothetical protein